MPSEETKVSTTCDVLIGRSFKFNCGEAGHYGVGQEEAEEKIIVQTSVSTSRDLKLEFLVVPRRSGAVIRTASTPLVVVI